MRQKVPTSKDLWEDNLEQAASLIQSNQTFLFSADIDPDSVGSMLSLALYLRMMGGMSREEMAKSMGLTPDANNEEKAES